MDAAGHLTHLQQLLPVGAAWSREPDAVMTDLLDALAQEYARLDTRADALIDEADVRTSLELLGDWERVLGLPNPCTASVSTTDGRRLAAWQALAMQAGHTRAFYVQLAASIGATIEIHEFDPAVDSYAPDLTPLLAVPGAYRFVWRVHVLSATDFWLFRAGFGRAGDRLQDGGALDLECLINAAKPAHTSVIFTYEES